MSFKAIELNRSILAVHSAAELLVLTTNAERAFR